MKLFKTLSLAFLFAGLSFSLYAENEDSLTVTMVEESYADSLPYYEAAFGADKFVPDTLKLAFYTALSRYPELWNCTIRLASRSIGSTMEARPVMLSLLGKKENREYLILLNDRKGSEKGLSYSKLNFEVLVGWFAHELAHVASYEERSTWEMMGFGFNYIFSGKAKKNIEREADAMACERGFANAIYQGKLLLLAGEDISKDYKKRVRSYYLSPAEIRTYLVVH